MAYFLSMWFLLSLLGVPVFAKDLGIHGHTFPVAEEDFLEFIQSKLLAFTPSELSALQLKIRNHYANMAQEPTPVDGLKEATHRRVFLYDPTITVSQHIEDHEGNVIIEKGTTVNPLMISSLNAELLFFDGTNQSHIEWAKEQHPGAKWILVKGRPMDLELEQGRHVYFDQFGVLVRKLEIICIPAKVMQEGIKLKIEEIPVGAP